MCMGVHGSMWVLAWSICVHVYIHVGVWVGPCVVMYVTIWACVASFGWLAVEFLLII